MNMLKITKSITFTLLLATLTGCASMNSSFDCPNKPGVNCRSIDQVNEMVERGVIGRNISSSNLRAPSFYPMKSSLGSYNMHGLSNSLRTGEQVVRVWIAPYQDVNNNYHNESTLYTVVRKNNWTVPKEVKE